MLPSSPTRFRPIVRARAALGSATALLSAALCAAALLTAAPAAADAGASGAPGDGRFATARIAAVDWCGMGDVGAVGDGTGRAAAPSAARWDSGGDGVAGPQHFPDAPEHADSSAAQSDRRLEARAAVEGLRFDPECAALPGEDGESTPLAAVFGADALVAVESADARARWTPDAGAAADVDVRGLEVLGEPVEVQDGPVERTFTANGPHGPVSVEATVRVAEHELADGEHGSATASAGLALEFRVDTGSGADGGPDGSYRVDLTGASVYAGDERAAPPAAPSSPGPDADRDSGERPSERGSAPPSGDGSGGGQDGGTSGTPEAEPEPEPSTGPGPDSGAGATADPRDLALDPSAVSGGGRLPVTGASLAAMSAAAALSIAAGAAAVYLARDRRPR